MDDFLTSNWSWEVIEEIGETPYEPLRVDEMLNGSFLVEKSP